MIYHANVLPAALVFSVFHRCRRVALMSFVGLRWLFSSIDHYEAWFHSFSIENFKLAFIHEVITNVISSLGVSYCWDHPSSPPPPPPSFFLLLIFRALEGLYCKDVNKIRQKVMLRASCIISKTINVWISLLEWLSDQESPFKFNFTPVLFIFEVKSYLRSSDLRLP